MNEQKQIQKIYNELMLHYIFYYTTFDITFDTAIRRANVYAVKNTWKIYCERKKLNDTNNNK